jgi:hypothetical protein
MPKFRVVFVPLLVWSSTRWYSSHNLVAEGLLLGEPIWYMGQASPRQCSASASVVEYKTHLHQGVTCKYPLHYIAYIYCPKAARDSHRPHSFACLKTLGVSSPLSTYISLQMFTSNVQGVEHVMWPNKEPQHVMWPKWPKRWQCSALIDSRCRIVSTILVDSDEFLMWDQCHWLPYEFIFPSICGS